MNSLVKCNVRQKGATTMKDKLIQSLFLGADMVPAAYRIAAPIEQRQHLCDGVIKETSP
jgi:hypothetical protein